MTIAIFILLVAAIVDIDYLVYTLVRRDRKKSERQRKMIDECVETLEEVVKDFETVAQECVDKIRDYDVNIQVDVKPKSEDKPED